jgi:hypothetical protein
VTLILLVWFVCCPCIYLVMRAFGWWRETHWTVGDRRLWMIASILGPLGLFFTLLFVVGSVVIDLISDARRSKW